MGARRESPDGFEVSKGENHLRRFDEIGDPKRCGAGSKS